MERTKTWTLSETEGLTLSLCVSDSSMVKSVLFPDLFFPPRSSQSSEGTAFLCSKKPHVELALDFWNLESEREG